MRGGRRVALRADQPNLSAFDLFHKEEPQCRRLLRNGGGIQRSIGEQVGPILSDVLRTQLAGRRVPVKTQRNGSIFFRIGQILLIYVVRRGGLEPHALSSASTSMENRGFCGVSPTFIPLISLGSMFAHFPRFSV